MADVKLTRRGRRHVKSIQRSRTRFELQKVATEIQNEVERRALTYDEAINIGNILQNHADMLPGDEIIYAISDRDAYRKTVELYLKDAILTRTEQLFALGGTPSPRHHGRGAQSAHAAASRDLPSTREERDRPRIRDPHWFR